MTEWLSMRAAFTRYAEGVTKPVKFDSFRRLVTQRKVWSRKVGHYKEVSANALEGYIQVVSAPLSHRVVKAVLDNIHPTGPMYVFVDEEEMTKERGGSVPQGRAWTGNDEDWEVVHDIIETLEEDTNPETFRHTVGDRVFRVWYGAPVLVIGLESMNAEATKLIHEVKTASIGWLLDWMASRGVVVSSMGKDGERLYKTDDDFKEAWEQAQAEGLV